MKTKLEHALALATMGFWVFRLQPDGKKPAKVGWQVEATRDPKKIKQLFDGSQDYNIGIFTSKFGDDGRACLAVDEDNKGNKKGADTLLQLDFEGFDMTPQQGKAFTGTKIAFTRIPDMEEFLE
ncbi:MAG: bifunctional DNA primase/polymerase [Proteobacteria bacterium]|nr:bifunctional DNA primase/polymerase [Pseudomonadota bacterium]